MPHIGQNQDHYQLAPCRNMFFYCLITSNFLEEIVVLLGVSYREGQTTNKTNKRNSFCPSWHPWFAMDVLREIHGLPWGTISQESTARSPAPPCSLPSFVSVAWELPCSTTPAVRMLTSLNSLHPAVTPRVGRTTRVTLCDVSIPPAMLYTRIFFQFTSNKVIS